MIDTHTHLYFPEYNDEIEDVIKKSIDTGVRHFVLPNVDIDSIEPIKNLHVRFPEVTTMAMGLHPTEVKENWEEVLDIIEKELSKGDYKAIGEIGMDLYWDKTFIPQQKEAFERQLKWAENNSLPVIIHSREALVETLEVIEKVKPTVTLIFHSFTGTTEDVERIRQVCDPYFGINGVVTYKNAPYLREALSNIGLERMLLETDAPFLTPVPHRGKRNDSSYLLYIQSVISETLGVDPKVVEMTTDKNAIAIFGI